MKLAFSLFVLLCTTTVFGQADSLQPAYKRFPTVPGLQLLLSDSTTKYTKADLPKKKPVLLVFFSPDCEHCQHEAEQMALHKEELKDIHIVMATTLPVYKMKAFAEQYGLNQMENVVVARDIYYLLPGFYQIRNLPYLALYDKKGKLIETFEGSVGMDKILSAFAEAK